MLTVVGTGFAGTGTLACRTGTGISHSAVWRSSSMIECTVGGHSSGGNVTVQVSNDGRHFSTDGVTLEVITAVVLKSVEPSQGSTAGNELVTVYGSGLGTGHGADVPLRQLGTCAWHHRQQLSSAVLHSIIRCSRHRSGWSVGG